MISITYTYQVPPKSKFVVGLVTETATMDWKLDDESPILQEERKVEVLSVVADGDELTYLKEHFTGIPFVNGKGDNSSLTWRGEFARFIFDNL